MLFADKEPGASSWSPTWVQGPNDLSHPLSALPDHQQGAGSAMEQPGYEPVCSLDTRAAERVLACTETINVLAQLSTFKLQFFT